MEPIPRELALRIGLASRVLPGVDVGHLLEILHDRLGTPLTDEKLKTVTVTQLKTGIGSADGEEDGEDIGIGLANIKMAVRFLWGEEAEDSNLPQVVPFKDGDMPDSIRVAIASNSGACIDGHFGSCIRFLVYQVSTTEIRLIGIRSTIGADESEDKNGFRVDLIKDCHVLFVQSIGGPAAAKVIRADIYPMKIQDAVDAERQLQDLQRVMAGSPPPWLAKILGKSVKERIRFLRKQA